MDQEVVKRVAARCVVDGMRRSAALESEAWRERQMAHSMPKRDAQALHASALGKFARAKRIRQLCGRLALAHGIGPKRTGRGWQPRPVQVMKKTTTIANRRLADAF